MGMIDRMFLNSELKPIRGVLDEAEHRFRNEAFALVRAEIDGSLKSNPADAANNLKSGTTPRQIVYTAIANIAGDHLESGRYHIYRGTLDPLGLGSDLLILYDAAIDELVQISSLDPNRAQDEKAGLRSSIQQVG